MLAVDTEFMRTQTYYPIAALLQVNDGEANYLIDPKAIEDLSPFTGLLIDPNILKVLHSCSEDLEVFQRLLNVVPVNLFDTQVAAALCGFGFSVGYGNLVKAALGKELPKSETRSDWLQRPLSKAQVEYAAVDVEDLYQLANYLILKLKTDNRLFWATEECASLLQNYANNQGEENCYTRIKQGWRLNRPKMAILKSLAVWREQRAQKRDIPRNRVIKEHSLMDIAMVAPEHVSQLRKFEGISERMIRSDGDELIALVEAAKNSDPESFPPLMDKPLTSSENKWAKKLRAAVVRIGEEKDIAPELLMKKRGYEAITRHFFEQQNDDLEYIQEQLEPYLISWRRALLQEPLANVIYGEE